MISKSVFVVLAGFFGQFIIEGLGLTCELFLPHFRNQYNWSNLQVTLVSSAVNGLSFLLGPVSGFMAHKLGDRHVIMFCGVLGAAAFVAGSFCSELWQLILTNCLVGTSFGLASVPVTTAVSFHFTTHRHVLTTAATTGGAVGGVVLPFVLESVLSESPWQYGYSVCACIMLQLVVCGALFSKPNNNKSEDDSDSEIDLDSKHAPSKSSPVVLMLMFLMHSIIWNFGTFMYYTIIPLRLNVENYTGYEIALVFSVISMFVILGRLFACLLVVWKRCDVVLSFNCSMLLMAVSLLSVSWKHAYIFYLCGFATYGFAFGVATAVIPSVIINLMGMDKVKIVVGLEFFTAGIAGLCGPLVAGWMADMANNDFFIVSLVSSLLIFVAVPLLLPYHWPIRRSTL